jgi:predicted transposase/invertase (TIGR01784 family)
LTSIDVWSLFFNYADNPAYRGLINNLITAKKEINMATELLMEISQEERERAIMRSRRMYETDRFNEMQTAIDRGIAKGMEKGMAKGRAEGKAEIIELLDKGVSIDEIKTRLGL